jgi:hypothetical protein
MIVFLKCGVDEWWRPILIPESRVEALSKDLARAERAAGNATQQSSWSSMSV